MIDLRYVKKLVELLDESTVDSIEISSDKGMKIRLSKTPQQRGGVQISQPIAVPALIATPPVAAPGPGGGSAGGVSAGGIDSNAEGAKGAEALQVKLLEVKSPMVGTFFRSPEPGAKPYVAEGSRIEAGMILCIIEAMKIMNEIESEFSGVVREVSVDDAHPVEYGQVLFRVEPNA